MGIGLNIASACVLAAARKPLGRVLLLGRQTMLFTPASAVGMIRSLGFEPRGDTDNIGLDTSTLASTGDYIRDDEFFRLLGAREVRALDHSDYEGADIIHNLNQPIPTRMEGQFDLILDGSTIDNVWDPAMCVRNIAGLLRPGGCLVSVNMATNHNAPYTVLTPTWLIDYFILNRFTTVHLAVTTIFEDGSFNAFAPDLQRLARGELVPNFVSPHPGGLQLFVEKGDASTVDVIPSQQQYRSEAEWDIYRKAVADLLETQVKSPWSSGCAQKVETPVGYIFA